MKKRNYIALGLVLASSTIVGYFNSTISSPLKEECNDVLSQDNNLKTNLRLVAIGGEELSVSKTFVQYGKNSDNKYVLRFATAVKGNISSVKYVREIAGKDIVEREVTDVYRGIIANGSTYYYDGSDITTNAEYMGQYYWACYSIVFKTDTYRSSNISAYVKVLEEGSTDIVNSTSRTTSLQTLIDEDPDTIALKNAKNEKINSLSKIDNRFRVEEQNALNAKKEEVINEINALETVEEVNNYSTSAYEELYNNTITDAQYLFEEMKDYDTKSDWPLVTEHRNTWTYEKGKITTNSIGYVISDNQYNLEGMSFEFSVASATEITDTGILLVNQNNLGYGGLDGYLLNIKSNGTEEFFQVYYLKNAYASNPFLNIDYMGGWVYPTSINGQTLRIEIKDGLLKSYDQGSSVNGGETIDLSATMPEKVSIGVLCWSGNLCEVNFNNLITNTAVNNLSLAQSFAEKEIKKIDFSGFADDGINKINAKILEVRNATTYKDTMTKINELKTLVSSTPSKYEAQAISLMDHIFSDDHSIKSTWDAVQANMNAWTHVNGTNSVINPGNAGWQLADDELTNFRLKVNMSGATPINPFKFNHYISRAFLIGAEPAEQTSRFKGYAVTVLKSSTEAWVQLHYFDGSSDCYATVIDAWGADCDGKDFTIEVNNGVFKLYYEDGTPFGTSYNGKTEATLSKYTGGHVGVFSWTYDTEIAPVVQTTMSFKELRILD